MSSMASGVDVSELSQFQPTQHFKYSGSLQHVTSLPSYQTSIKLQINYRDVGYTSVCLFVLIYKLLYLTRHPDSHREASESPAQTIKRCCVIPFISRDELMLYKSPSTWLNPIHRQELTCSRPFYGVGSSLMHMQP